MWNNDKSIFIYENVTRRKGQVLEALSNDS